MAPATLSAGGSSPSTSVTVIGVGGAVAPIVSLSVSVNVSSSSSSVSSRIGTVIVAALPPAGITNTPDVAV